ncbi:MAG TPA: BRO family protein [Acidobacteriota bacterium]|nr:BRO family protein [Acidobacteriota bacterium]HNG93598.1 BRO family protein [Acidobacteriota bacterium]
MSDLTFYYFGKVEVRTIRENGKVWFVAADVAEILGVTRNRIVQILKNIKDTAKGVRRIYTPGSEQNVVVISEEGVYQVLMASTRPNAEKFKKWLAEEVLPQIRKTGRYIPTSILDYAEHTKEPQQKTMSRAANEFNFEHGGKESIISYNVENCIAHTGEHPLQVKERGKKAKLKAVDRASAKAVLRKLQPEVACAMSLADNLVSMGAQPDKVFEVTKKAAEVFKGMIDLGFTPPELNR